MTAVEQLLDILMVDLAALALTIRAVIAHSLNLNLTFAFRPFVLSPFLGTQTFVYADTQPIECLEDIFLCTGHETGAVRIFDTKQHIAAVLAGKQIVIQGSAHTADMQRAGRTRRKTYSNSSFHYI